MKKPVVISLESLMKRSGEKVSKKVGVSISGRIPISAEKFNSMFRLPTEKELRGSHKELLDSVKNGTEW